METFDKAHDEDIMRLVLYKDCLKQIKHMFPYINNFIKI